MKEIITMEYLINLIILLIFHMHMFQLNSYFFKKHLYWMKVNIKKIVIQIILIIFPTILLCLNNMITNLISIVLLAGVIFYNFPKRKAKISFKITNRVKRMFVTEFILILFIFMISGNTEIYIKLCILNILSSIMCMISNLINFPIEYMRKKRYINEAKKIINNMPNLLVIGVTGSYGKTSVKNFLSKTLSTKYEVLTTPLNYNTTMGIVKTIREKLKPIHQIFICEMGATNIGDIKEICDIVRPKIGIITAIGPQHLESFKSIDNIIKAKFELLDAVKRNNGTAFINYDNQYLAKQKLDMNVVTYGVNNKDLNYNAYNLNSSSKGLSFKILDDSNKEIEFKTKLIGKHNVINLTVAIGVAKHVGIPLERLVHSIREIRSVEHRLQLISRGKLTIIDDSYNSNPISSKSALETLAEFKGTKIVVTPGLIELGKDSEKYNFELGQHMTNKCDFIFLVNSEYTKTILQGIISKNFDKKRIYEVKSPQEAIKQILNLGIEGEITVLLENDLPDNYNV